MTSVREPQYEDVPVFEEAFAAWLGEHRLTLQAWRDQDLDSKEDGVVHERQLQRLLWDGGWSRWGWSTACGGYGGSVRHRAVMFEKLWQFDIAVPEAFALIEVLGAAIERFAPAFAADYIPRFVMGDALCSQGFSEPESGSDLASLRLRAAPRPDGFFVLNGQKTWNTMGQMADTSLVLARTGPSDSRHRGITVLLVDLSSPGVLVRPIPAVTGRREFAEIFFDDVVVAPDRIVGEVNGGWDVIHHILEYERGSFAWLRMTMLYRKLEKLVARVTTLGEGKAQVGQLFAELTALRLLCRKSIRLLADGRSTGSDGSVSKLVFADVEQRMMSLAEELLFPEVEVGDSHAARQWRFDLMTSTAASIYGGANEIQKNVISERVLHLPREKQHRD